MNWKKDHLGYGILLGLIIPAVIYSILHFLAPLLNVELRDSTTELVSIFAALPLFRYFIINLGAEKTGRGMLLIIFLYAIFFCIREFNMF